MSSGLCGASFAHCADDRAREVWKEYHAEQRIKRLDRAPREAMQAFVKLLLRERGYRDVMSFASRDDKRVQLVVPLCDGRRLAIQVRKGSGALGAHAVEELISALAENGCHCGFVVCSSGFTRGAKERARQDGRIRLLDRRWLVEMTRKYLADDLPPFDPAAYERLMRSWAGRKALRQTSPCRDLPFESIRFRTAS